MTRINDIARFIGNKFSTFIALLFIVYLVLPVLFYPRMDFYKSYYYLAIMICWFILCAPFVILFLWLRVKKFYKKIDTSSSKKNHLAVFIVKYSKLFKSVSYDGIEFKSMYKTLKENNINYVNYVISNKTEFINYIKNSKVKAVFIFAHGQKHGVQIDKKMLYYCDVPKLLNIKYAAQFHCNHFQGRPLKDYLKCDGFVTDDLMISPEINGFIKSKTYVNKLKRALKI